MKRVSVIALFVIMVCLSVFPASAVDYMFYAETVSKSVYLESLSAKTVVYEKDADRRSYPASTTKIMTYIITAENVSDFDQTAVTIRQDAIEGLDPESTVMGLSSHIGEQVSVRDLLYGLMLPSGNDAALVLADYVGGSIPEFVSKMNAKAAELGCTNTHFVNPHGLFDSEHYTTARDMAQIAKYAMTLPGFMEICNTVYYTPDGFDTLHNTNYMLDEYAEDGAYYYPYTRGIKTGYLDEAGKCLVTSSDKEGDQYICVCLGADYSFSENINYAMKDTAKLYDWAYENLGVQTIYSPSDSLASVDVKYVREGKTLSAVPEKEITAFLPKQYDKKRLDTRISCPDQVEAPVKKGDVLGTVSVRYEDLELGTVNLVATEDVERNVSHLRAFVQEHTKLTVISAVSLLLLIIFLIVLIRIKSVRKRRGKRPSNGRRYRD